MNLNTVDGRVMALCTALLEELDDLPAPAGEMPEAAECTPPAGGHPGCFAALAAPLTGRRRDAIADAGAAGREQQARTLAESGALRSPAAKPSPTPQERDALAARIAAADDDAAVLIARDPRAMAIATPEQKAALVRKLMDGHTNGAEEQAIKAILLGCASRDELDKVAGMSGGWDAIADELDAGDLGQVQAHGQQLAARQDAAVQDGLGLLEQASTPEEFRRLFELLGGEQLKHQLPTPPRPEQLGRLEALGAKHGAAGVGFGMPPEKTASLQAAIRQAIDKGDNDAIVKLSENGEAMKAASPAEKARMIRILQDGWTKDRQDMAIARILTSCGSKAEFDQVVDQAGGRAILADIDFPEAKADINKLMGGFDRLDCADDRATAEAYRGVLLPPQVDQLSATREPGAGELDAVSGEPPAGAGANARVREVRQQMGRQAHDVQGDPMARNKLALVNRDRQIHGQPPLDHTALVTKAYQVANDPSFLADVNRAIAEAEKSGIKLDDEGRQEIREKLLAQRLGAVAKAYGLSEQEMKTLVSAKMGRVLQEGAAAVRSLGDDPAMHAWADRMQVTGQTAANLFKVPPSFAEDFVAAISVIGDALAAVVNVIPGVGQAISGAYFGVKAIVGLANGDILGAFKSVLSAIPGVSGVFGAASAVINTGAKLVQAGIAAGEGIANGNPLAFVGAVGSMAGNLGLDPLKAIPGGSVLEKLPAGLRAVGAGPLASQIEAIAASPAAQAFAQNAVPVGRLVAALGSGDAGRVGQALGHWLPVLQSNPLSQAIAGLGAQAAQALGSPELNEALRQARGLATQARDTLEQIAALRSRVGDVRRFEDALLGLGASGAPDWQAVGAELLRRLGAR